MIFGANIITPTGQTPSPPSDSGSPALGKSATGSIRSQSFLAAPNLQPGGIQELIHGCSALLTTPGRVPGDIQVIVKGGWNRTIQQYENVTVKGDSTHEHDDSLYAEFALPGTLENTFLNGDVSRYYLNGHHLTINDILTETIGVGGSGSEVTLNTLRFGDDRITARAGSNCDLQVILGDSTSVHVGNTWFDWATGAVSRIIAGAHFESYQDSSQGGASGQLSQMRSKDAHDLHTSLNAMLGSDPGRLPHWNAPSSSSWFQLKTLLFPGINWNLKATMEFTYAGSRAAWTGWGGAFRGYHSFVNGLYFVGKGIKAAFDALHANFAALCGRVNLFGFGNPRAIFPSPPPTPADADAALSAAELAQEAEGAAAALGKTAETAAKVAAATPQAAAQEALDEATARETAAQAAVDDLTPKF
ncbi:MAG TPA: hypothetical protein VHZ55_02930, partial [Bryobacteraceae bacterium]|nr:hypothetical protein [Bryobacteraceae bacterium]